MGCISSEALKHRLVTEICSVSTNGAGSGCTHIPRRCSGRPEARFIDWYLLLGVEENAGVDVIRKRYHKLALQVHPDKNDHPNAEVAFKLLSEAYTCLTDAAKRRAFDTAKWRNSCSQCRSLRLHRTIPPSAPHEPPGIDALKNMRDRFREEVRVIENCMRANAAATLITKECFRQHISSKTVSFGRKESPVFDPSMYEFGGYPHVRSRVDKDDRNRRWFRTTAANGPMVFVSTRDRLDRGLDRSKSVCLRS